MVARKREHALGRTGHRKETQREAGLGARALKWVMTRSSLPQERSGQATSAARDPSASPGHDRRASRAARGMGLRSQSSQSGCGPSAGRLACGAPSRLQLLVGLRLPLISGRLVHRHGPTVAARRPAAAAGAIVARRPSPSFLDPSALVQGLGGLPPRPVGGRVCIGAVTQNDIARYASLPSGGHFPLRMSCAPRQFARHVSSAQSRNQPLAPFHWPWCLQSPDPILDRGPLAVNPKLRSR